VAEEITEAEALAEMPHQDDRYEIRRLRGQLERAEKVQKVLIGFMIDVSVYADQQPEEPKELAVILDKVRADYKEASG
jgi:hypothetical protein